MAKCGPCQNRNVPFNVKDALLLLLQQPSRGKLMLDMATNKYSEGNEIEYIWKMHHALVLFLHAKHHYSRPLYSLNYGIFYPILDFFTKFVSRPSIRLAVNKGFAKIYSSSSIALAL